MPDQRAIALLEKESARFDLIYLDPPYAMDLAPVLAALKDAQLLAEGGLIIAEHDAHADFPAPEGWRMARRKTYRDTALSFYEEDA